MAISSPRSPGEALLSLNSCSSEIKKTSISSKKENRDRFISRAY
jgi:hypothetical protein